MLDERVGKPIQHENCVGRVRKSWKKSLIEIKLSSTQNFLIQRDFQFFRKSCDRRNRSNISSNMGKMLCWMKCWTGLPRPLLLKITKFEQIALSLGLEGSEYCLCENNNAS